MNSHTSKGQTQSQTLFGMPVVVVDGALAQPVTGYPLSQEEMLAGIANPALLSPLLEGVSKVPQITREVGGMLVAEAIQTPVRAWDLRIRRQVGRFVLIEYRPINQNDPDIILPVTASPSFTKAMLNHQKARTDDGLRNPRAWYRRVMRSVRGLVPPLEEIWASPEEAAFVLLWAMGNASAGRTTPVLPTQQRERRQRKRRKPKHEPATAVQEDIPDYAFWDSMAIADAGL